MTKRFSCMAVVFLTAALCAPSAFAQATGTVKGKATDLQGAPIAGATVEWVSPDTGRKYDLKTNNKGEYFSLGITLGHYNVRLIKDGKQIYNFNNVAVSSDETTLDFDLKKEMATQAQQQGMSPEEMKKRQEQAEKANKENMNIKVLNEKLAAARADMQAKNYDQAIAAMNEANQIDPNRDVLWYTLGDANRLSALSQTDAAEKSKRLMAAVEDYQKAIQIKQTDAQQGAKDPNAAQVIGSYYNNMGDAYAKAGKADDATKAYTQAAEADPARAGMYYFNEGATMTNANTANDPKMRQAAVDAFNKAIAADPNKADAYYWKGSNLIGMATLQGDKMVAPDGTAEAFQKYLELQPTGPHAEEAKAMLAGIGASVETSYGKKKSSKK